jgi:hypothetical protein
VTTKPPNPLSAEAAAHAAEFLASRTITTTICQQCGTEIAGVCGRYSCGICGWVNHWSQGDTELPPLPDLDDDGNEIPGS